MKDELKRMQDNEIWELVELPNCFKPIYCKWSIKPRRITRLKVRLVPKGSTQREGIDFKKNLSLTISNDLSELSWR